MRDAECTVSGRFFGGSTGNCSGAPLLKIWDSSSFGIRSIRVRPLEIFGGSENKRLFVNCPSRECCVCSIVWIGTWL